MGIRQRRYKLLADFDKVSRFLDENYTLEGLNSYLLQPFFEYAHTHPAFNHKLTHRFGIWEDGTAIVGLACYEMDLGEAFISVREGYQFLLPKMLVYAESELSVIREGKHCLGVWVTDKEEEKRKLLQDSGYELARTEAVTIFPLERKIPERELPQGFSLISLEDENNLKEINACLWKGFDHGPDPDDDYDCRLLMQSGPNFSPGLTTIVKDEKGHYACFAGMWYNSYNRYAYLEPLATVPEYRGLGLATVGVVEGMKKARALGAEYCFGGTVGFYNFIGFETICNRHLWRKGLR